MDNGVDDIFKSFVNSKLKQLGMHGSSTFDLEKSLQQSALGKLDGVVDVDTENCLIEGKKKKKEKKKKKHKKEKKPKKHKTDTNTSKTNSISNSQSSANSSSLNIFSRNNETSSSSIEKLPVCLSNSLTCKKEKDSSPEFSQLKEKDPQLKEKDPQLKDKDPQLKEKDPQLKDKDPQLKDKDPQLKENDPQLKEKDFNRYSPESPKGRKRSHKKHHHHRSRSRSPKRRRHHHHHRHRSRERSRHRSRRSRSNSPVISSKDKMKLLEIAKANVLAQHQAGVTASHLSLESSALLCSGGASLQQLTGVCKDISDGKREVFKYNKSNESTSKVNHPFQVREAPAISINIKTMVPSVTSKSINDLTKEYPVSCGIQHQCKEVMEGVYGKWEPIEKKDEIKEKKSNGDKKVFSDSSEANELSIKDVIAQRVNAVRTLNTDPNDQDAMRHMAEVQSKLNTWTSSKLVPGQFTGSTGVQPLSKNELNRGLQAWATQNSLNPSKRVDGIGKSLLQKMGWKEGDSLGKTNVGLMEPLKLQVKTDRKGLSSVMEMPISVPTSMKRHTSGLIVTRDLSGKHPVSAIMEICSKRKWKAPDFMLVQNDGPDHHRSFIFKVLVNGVYYQPSVPSMNKKLAKAQAATAALQALGLIPP